MLEVSTVTKNKAYKGTFQRGTVLFPIQYSMCNTVDPHYDLPLHWHREFELIHVLAGTYTLYLGDKEIKLQKNDLCFIPGEIIHGDAQDKGMALYESIVFDIDLLRLHTYSPDIFFSDILSGNIVPDNVITSDHTNFVSIAEKIFASVKTKEEGYDISASGYLLIFFGLIKHEKLYRKRDIAAQSRTKEIREEQINSVLNLIRKNYGSELTLQSMSDTVALSPKYFCRLFKESTGRTPIEYLNWFRINRACTLLKDTNEKLLDIAMECGFNDFSYFTKIFHRYKGMPPSKYRNFSPQKTKEIILDPDYLWEKNHPEEAKTASGDSINTENLEQ